ncbi:hypothetical protein GCM10017691_19570 [Pseudonocardia petroleophila]
MYTRILAAHPVGNDGSGGWVAVAVFGVIFILVLLIAAAHLTDPDRRARSAGAEQDEHIPHESTVPAADRDRDPATGST